MPGPLEGIRILEFAGIGPGPFTGMLLADMGADVVRIDRVGDARAAPSPSTATEVLNRGRRSVAIDLKTTEGLDVALRLVDGAEALIEGFRPGVMERLGLGPEVCLERVPSLVYGRVTGWGQDGPLASAPGHDINYIALAGALDPIGRRDGPPVPPLNLVGDFGGGGMLLAFGIACGVVHSRETGEGQVVDAAMVDGAALQMASVHGLVARGVWKPERGTNLLDTGAHFYEVYETRDGGYVSIGSIEPQFYAELLRHTGIADGELPQFDRERWPAHKDRLAKVFRSRTRAEWCDLLEGSDVCFAPVLSLAEAPFHEHNSVRSTFIEPDGVVQPAPAPRFSLTPGEVQGPPSHPGKHTMEVLLEAGLEETRIGELRTLGAIA